MAETPKDNSSKGGSRIPDAGTQKRPHATLDLRATEVEIRPAASASATADAKASTEPPKGQTAANAPEPETVRSGPEIKPSTASKPAASASNSTPPPPARSGGSFFSHLAASIVGGAIALGGAQYALPELGFAPKAGDTAASEQRLAALEKQVKTNSATVDLEKRLAEAEARLTAFEGGASGTATSLAALAKSSAETQSTIAALKQQTADNPAERIAKLEERFALLAAEGASNPNAGPVPQIAALTGKVTDLETSIDTKITAARTALLKEITDGLSTTAATSEAAKSGTQRLDRELAATTEETARLGERVQSIKSDADKLSEGLKIANEKIEAVTAAVDGLKGSVAKPQDVATAVAPVAEKLVALEKSVADVVKSEGDRRANAERIVLALELSNLKRALDRGLPYAAEFASVAKASGGKTDLTALARYKDDGVLPLAELNRQFRPVAAAAIDAEAKVADAGIVDQLLAGARSVVRVRKVEHNPDDRSTEAVVARMEAALRDGRLGEFLDEQKQLSDKARAATVDFTAKVEARHTADRVIAGLESELKSALAPEAAAQTPAN